MNHDDILPATEDGSSTSSTIWISPEPSTLSNLLHDESHDETSDIAMRQGGGDEQMPAQENVIESCDGENADDADQHRHKRQRVAADKGDAGFPVDDIYGSEVSPALNETNTPIIDLDELTDIFTPPRDHVYLSASSPPHTPPQVSLDSPSMNFTIVDSYDLAGPSSEGAHSSQNMNIHVHSSPAEASSSQPVSIPEDWNASPLIPVSKSLLEPADVDVAAPPSPAAATKEVALALEPLAVYTCPICFSPPTNATLTPCGHICCGPCLFAAVKSTIQRNMLIAMERAPVPRCPVCRAEIPGWDGRGGGVFGLDIRSVLTV